MDEIFPEMHVAAMDEKPKTVLQTRLSALMEAQKKKAAPLATQVGLNASFIRDILRGKTKTPAADALARIADALGTTSDYLLGNDKDGELTGPAIERSGKVLQYAGIIQAGAFLPVDDFNQDPEDVPDYVLPDQKYGRVRQYAWKSRGDSMDEAGIHDGMWVVGADAADYVDTYGDIITGDLVVVERVRYQGAERELTVKEVHFFRDRYELRPVSSNAEHVPIIVQHDHQANGDEVEVKIIGVVLTAYANLKRRR